MIADGIRKLIAEKRITKQEAARRAGFTGQQLSDMLNGRKTIKADYVPRIAGALGVSIQELYDAGEEGE